MLLGAYYLWGVGGGDAEVSDVVELHSGGDVRAALDEGIPDAGAIGEDVGQFFDPDRIFDGVGIAGEHLECAHGAEGAVDEEGDVVGVNGTGVAGFDDDGGLAADGGGVIEIACGGGIAGTFAPDD